MSPVTLDFSKAEPITKATGVTLDFSRAQPIQRPGAGAANLGMPEDISTGPEGTTPVERLMSPHSQDEATVGGLMAGAAGAVGIPAAAMAPTTMAGAGALLMPIVKKYGIKALEGAGLGAGYDLYRELKKVFEGEK